MIPYWTPMLQPKYFLLRVVLKTDLLVMWNIWSSILRHSTFDHHVFLVLFFCISFTVVHRKLNVKKIRYIHFIGAETCASTQFVALLLISLKNAGSNNSYFTVFFLDNMSKGIWTSLTKILRTKKSFNPLQPRVAFLYPLKTSENL